MRLIAILGMLYCLFTTSGWFFFWFVIWLFTRED